MVVAKNHEKAFFFYFDSPFFGRADEVGLLAVTSGLTFGTIVAECRILASR